MSDACEKSDVSSTQLLLHSSLEAENRGESRNLHQRAGRKADRPGEKGWQSSFRTHSQKSKPHIQLQFFCKRVIAPWDKAVFQINSILSFVRG